MMHLCNFTDEFKNSAKAAIRHLHSQQVLTVNSSL